VRVNAARERILIGAMVLGSADLALPVGTLLLEASFESQVVVAVGFLGAAYARSG
jgi:hypothetical protein